MIPTSICFMDFDTFSLAKFANNLTDALEVLSINDLSSIFWGKNNVILTSPFAVC